MSDDAIQPGAGQPLPPVSSYGGPVGELIGQRFLAPPSRPGLAAVLDRFEILHVLGGGGMGIVLLARDPPANQEVAIKLVRPELASDEQVLRRFVKETGHMQKLRHPNIVPVREISPASPGAYFVMPYFEGGNLSRWIKAGGATETEFPLSIAIQVAEGLQFAHRHGIIHRDLKPANILLTGHQKACLADFGLARTLFNDTIVDVEGQQCEGTAPYMSPAVAAGQAEDTRCDIYAFGALLYEMLTGEPPYAGTSTRDIRLKILTGGPRPILTVNPRADRGLAAIAEGAMGRELRDRYADMADVLADLRRVQCGRPPTGPNGLKRRMRMGLLAARNRRPFAWTALGVTAALALGAAAWFLWGTTGYSPEVSVPASTDAAESALSPVFFPPLSGLGFDAAGGLYAGEPDRCVVVKIGASGNVAIHAGRQDAAGNAGGFGGDARFSLLRGLAVDGPGQVFVADGYAIRRIDRRRYVTLIAGFPGVPGFIDGPGRAARFRTLSGLAVGRDGTLYVADTYTIRRISPSGFVGTLAGRDGSEGGSDGVGRNARFSDQTKSLAVGPDGNVYVADTMNCTLRRISPDGLVVTLAGLARAPGTADGRGAIARFSRPTGVAVDANGTIYVADTCNDTIRRISPAGLVTTLAGLSGQRGDRDGMGSLARFDHPSAMAIGPEGNLYVSDAGNRTIRVIRPDGAVSTLGSSASRSTAVGF